jgi:hypothetical protein
VAEILTAYLRATAAQVFRYGQDDCATLCIGWFDQLTGRDGLSKWRGRYDDRLSCSEFIGNGGGNVALADQFLADTYGATRAVQSEKGNVLLAKAFGERAFGIRLSSNQAAFRTPKGIMATQRFHVVAEWRCPNFYQS